MTVVRVGHSRAAAHLNAPIDIIDFSFGEALLCPVGYLDIIGRSNDA